MKQLRAIKIFHDVQTRIDFLFLAEFFHFCGLYVGEGVFLEPDYLNEADCSCFDVFLFTSSVNLTCESDAAVRYRALDKEVGGLIRFCDIRNNILKDGTCEIHRCEAELQERILIQCLNQITAKVNPKAGDIDWSFLVRVYVENNLMIHSASLQYYSKQKSFAVTEALDGMMGAYREIEERVVSNNLQWDWEIDDYVNYARIWCQTKVNTCCRYQNTELYFSPQTLAQKSKSLSQDYPDFSNAVVLQGLCYEHSKDKANEAISAFKQALDMDGGHCYTTAVLYWLGKRYEAYEARQEGAEYFYQKAYQTKKKFRNIYKLAMYEKDRKEYLKAEAYYREIIDILERRRLNINSEGKWIRVEKNMLDPLELEYEFKVCRQMCIMFFRDYPDVAYKYSKAIQYGEHAVKICEEEIDNSLMYERLYGKKKMQRYRNISKSRMELKNIYHILYLVYNDLQEYEKAREYRCKERSTEDWKDR